MLFNPCAMLGFKLLQFMLGLFNFVFLLFPLGG
jgi:hypothetical protein